MKIRLFALLFATALPAFAQTTERWDIPLDPRDWRLIAENRSGRLTERIYVAPGESEYFWNEKLVIGHQRLSFSPDDYLTGFLDFLSDQCRPYKVTPLKQEPTSVFLQWTGDCRITGPQFEYRRVEVAKDGVHIIAYASKTQRLSEAKRQAWLGILREAKLKPE
ncbi:MAG: hypothetical protein FJY34_08485 [Betaproteobacteria bacterium]|nr:hypothetical protein [Betaproteobacteria bacterium]